jgi:putative membrane protein
MKILIQIASNSLAIILAAYLLPGIEFSGSWGQLILAGAILGGANFLVKPILKLILAPLIILSLGIFTLLINIALLIATALLVPGLSIAGFWPAFWGIIIIALTNYSVNMILDHKE